MSQGWCFRGVVPVWARPFLVINFNVFHGHRDTVSHGPKLMGSKLRCSVECRICPQLWSLPLRIRHEVHVAGLTDDEIRWPDGPMLSHCKSVFFETSKAFDLSWTCYSCVAKTSFIFLEICFPYNLWLCFRNCYTMFSSVMQLVSSCLGLSMA